MKMSDLTLGEYVLNTLKELQEPITLQALTASMTQICSGQKDAVPALVQETLREAMGAGLVKKSVNGFYLKRVEHAGDEPSKRSKCNIVISIGSLTSPGKSVGVKQVGRTKKTRKAEFRGIINKTIKKNTTPKKTIRAEKAVISVPLDPHLEDEGALDLPDSWQKRVDRTYAAKVTHNVPKQAADRKTWPGPGAKNGLKNTRKHSAHHGKKNLKNKPKTKKHKTRH